MWPSECSPASEIKHQRSERQPQWRGARAERPEGVGVTTLWLCYSLRMEVTLGGSRTLNRRALGSETRDADTMTVLKRKQLKWKEVARPLG